jgi:hypothetical protein
MSLSSRRVVAWVRGFAAVLAVAVLLLGGMVGRTLVLGNAALGEAERAFDRGELRESVAQARRAATLAAPFAPHVDAAYARLATIARGAEAAGRLHIAAFAWSSMRAAAVESSSPLAPARPELELANRNLARLAARLGAERSEPVDPAAERAILATLERPARTPESSLVWAGVGLLSLLSGLGVASALGLHTSGEVALRPLAVGCLLVAIGVACWTLALYQA